MADHAQPAWARFARPDRDVNHVLAYGQSLAVGYEGWPALSLAQPYDSLMLGDSVRSLREATPHWRPTGEAGLRPLRATVQDLASGALLTAEQVMALPRGAGALGETVLEGALNGWRARQLAGGAVAGRRRLLASACGVGGRTLEALSKGAAPDLFNRLRECVDVARMTAVADGLSYGVVALLFLQGEHNNWGLNGGTAAAAAYKALLRRFHDDAVADLAVAIARQPEPPAIFLYQTGGAYASETQSVPQAQLECALEMPGCFMVAPSYPVTEKGGHLDANGYRWLGAQFGKVLHRVLTLNEAWRPLHPVRAERAGREVRVAFHVPVPPLRWGRPIVGRRFVDPADRGFTVLDAAGPIPIVDVRLDAPDAVRITLGRDPHGTATLRYADKGHAGRGALHDSDAEIAPDCYVYDPATGHDPKADIPELAGRPYPLMNWCVAFAIPLAPAAPLPRPQSRVWEILRETAAPLPASPQAPGWLATLRHTLGLPRE